MLSHIFRIIGLLLLGLGVAMMLATLIWYAVPLIAVGFYLTGFSIWNVIFRKQRNHE